MPAASTNCMITSGRISTPPSGNESVKAGLVPADTTITWPPWPISGATRLSRASSISPRASLFAVA